MVKMMTSKKLIKAPKELEKKAKELLIRRVAKDWMSGKICWLRVLMSGRY